LLDRASAATQLSLEDFFHCFQVLVSLREWVDWTVGIAHSNQSLNRLVIIPMCKNVCS
jgi:hypothetical protein